MKSTNISINFTGKTSKKSDTIVILAKKEGALFDCGNDLDKEINGWISYNIDNTPKFEGNKKQSMVSSMPVDSQYNKLVVAGVGDVEKLEAKDIEVVGGNIYTAIKSIGSEEITVLVDGIGEYKADDVAARIAYGIKLASYKFDKYKSEAEDKEKEETLKKVNIQLSSFKDAYELYSELDCVVEGIFLSRNLTNEPANNLYPESYVKIIKEEMKGLDVSIEILDEKKMQKLGMEAIFSVGKGSVRQPRMVIMKYIGAGKKDAPIAFVGKGVTFDTGGISLKPGAGMEDMKIDMCGSAVVVGLMKTLASRKAKVNVVAAVGLAENMPSEHAYRPSDIIGSYKGKTIEVINTDAEGRLVLADTLSYVQKKHKPHTVIDLATLTGAMMVALGLDYCGVFSNDNDLWNEINQAGDKVGEKFWRMPLDKSYMNEIKSEIADIKNMGSKYGGACTAAAFLQYFIEDGVKWSHLDIAGVALGKKSSSLIPKGGSGGFGVRTLNQLIKDKYEVK